VQGRRRRQAQPSSQDGQWQSVQESVQGLGSAQREVGNDTNLGTNMAMPSLGELVRAIGGGGEMQASGPSIIGQLMRSPVVENLVQQMMQQGVGDADVGSGARRGGANGGLDLSGMLQHVVPVVTQMLNGGPAAAFPGSTAGTSARTSSDGAGGATGSRESESERWQDALTPVSNMFGKECGATSSGDLLDACGMLKWYMYRSVRLWDLSELSFSDVVRRRC
jgi:hypothetical protein